MKNSGRNFRRIFGITFLTVSVLACKKNDINNSIEDIDNDSSVAIQLSAYEASSVMTKAALEEWNNTELYIFGLRRIPGKEVGEGAYDFTPSDDDNIVDRKAIANSGQNALEILNDKGEPYYYKRDYIYDFYGYYLGGAAKLSADPIISGDKYSYALEFDGSNDLMYAVTNRENDIRLQGYDVNDVSNYVYSERSARWGIVPRLVFNHALTRLNFIIKGKGSNKKYENVRITGVEVETVNKGTLVVTGPEVGFIPDPNAAPVSLSLKAADNSELTSEVVTQNTEDNVLGGLGACLMITPGMEAIQITVKLENTRTGKQIDAYVFTAEAAKVISEDKEVTSFEAGYEYDFYINVYGPEEIFISAILKEWTDGGDFTYDPDEGIVPNNPEPGPTPEPDPDPTPDPEPEPTPDPEEPGNEGTGGMEGPLGEDDANGNWEEIMEL